MKKNCTTCKKSNDGSPCDPPERSAAAQWIYDNQVNALTNREYIKKCDGCFDHEPRPFKRVVRMGIEPYVDEEGREWCWHSAENCCSSFPDKCPFRDKNHGYEPRPQGCIDAEIREEERKLDEMVCATCRHNKIYRWMYPCKHCRICGNGVLSYWSAKS
jgi:hypothetical protein